MESGQLARKLTFLMSISSTGFHSLRFQPHSFGNFEIAGAGFFFLKKGEMSRTRGRVLLSCSPRAVHKNLSIN